MNPHEIPEPSADPATNARRLRWGLGFFLLVAAYFLLTEHRAHVVAVLPWLFLTSRKRAALIQCRRLRESVAVQHSFKPTYGLNHR